MIFGYNNFGYEGCVVSVEVDLRDGIPAVDIVGLADGAVKECRERIKAAIRNQGFEFPVKRVLMSLSPSDLKKDGAGFDLPTALAVLSASYDGSDCDVLAIGELNFDGSVRLVNGIYAALCAAVDRGIKYAIVPCGVGDYGMDGIKVVHVQNLNEAYEALKTFGKELSNGNEPQKSSKKIEFEEINDEESMDNVEGMDDLKYAMAVAAAGRHHLLVFGNPGCGKTLMLQKMPQLLPKLMDDETESVNRIRSIAGILNGELSRTRPFRVPHQTASIEGMCGGGINCRPGEISLAHNGVLFLDEAAEFRSSVLQMIRVPLESDFITLSRAGRSTTYPAKFQLLMATNPCPCGNFGAEGKICLCSVRAVEQYWRKFSAPLLDRVSIRLFCNKTGKASKKWRLKELRGMVERAWKVQYERQGCLNQDVDGNVVEDVLVKFKDLFPTDASSRALHNMAKVARTIADMEC